MFKKAKPSTTLSADVTPRDVNVTVLEDLLARLNSNYSIVFAISACEI